MTYKASNNKFVYKYAKSHYKRYELRFRIDEDKAIIAKLESETNKNAYIKKLILDDISNKSEN